MFVYNYIVPSESLALALEEAPSIAQALVGFEIAHDAPPTPWHIRFNEATLIASADFGEAKPHFSQAKLDAHQSERNVRIPPMVTAVREALTSWYERERSHVAGI